MDSQNATSFPEGTFHLGDFLVQPPLKKVVRLGDGRTRDDGRGEGATEDGETAEEKEKEHGLPDKAMGVLVYLAEHPRRVCEREDILDAVWGEDREAHDRVLDNAVAEIRRALGDDARKPAYVQTVPRRGYRLLANPLTPADPPASPAAVHAEDPPSRSESRSSSEPSESRSTPKLRTSRWLPIVLVGALCLTLLWILRPASETVTVQVDVQVAGSKAWSEDVRKALLEEPHCLPATGLRVTESSRHPEVSIDIESKSSGLITARVRSEGRELLISARNVAADQASRRRMRSEIRAATQQLLCESEALSSRQRACLCLSAAEPLLSRQRPNEAAPLLERAVQLDPDLLSAYESLVGVYIALGDQEKAEETIHEGLSRNATVDSDMGLILRSRLATLLNDHDSAWDLVTQLEARHPDDSRWKAAKAKLLTIQRNDCDGAILLLADVEEASNPAIRLEKARALATCRRTKEAIELLRTTVAAAPREREARLWLVAALVDTWQLDEARQIASELVALAPDDMESFMLLTWLANTAGDYSEAVHWAGLAKEAAQWPEDLGRINSVLVGIALWRGDLAQCLQLTDSVDPAPGSSIIHQLYSRGICLMELGDIEGARRLLAELSSFPDTEGGRYDQAAIAMLSGVIEARTLDAGGSLELAIERFETATELASVYSGHWLRSGIELEAVGENDLAESFYIRGLESGPRHPWLNCQLGLHYREQGRTDEALIHLRLGMEVLGTSSEDELAHRCEEALESLDPQVEESEG